MLTFGTADTSPNQCQHVRHSDWQSNEGMCRRTSEVLRGTHAGLLSLNRLLGHRPMDFLAHKLCVDLAYIQGVFSRNCSAKGSLKLGMSSMPLSSLRMVALTQSVKTGSEAAKPHSQIRRSSCRGSALHSRESESHKMMRLQACDSFASSGPEPIRMAMLISYHFGITPSSRSRLGLWPKQCEVATVNRAPYLVLGMRKSN